MRKNDFFTVSPLYGSASLRVNGALAGIPRAELRTTVATIVLKTHTHVLTLGARKSYLKHG